MRFPESYQRTRDIDWFFRKGNRFIHAASNRGLLPYFVNDIQRLRMEQAKVSMLNDIEDIEIAINESYVNQRIATAVSYLRSNGNEEIDFQSMRDSYLASFVAMARKGFYSYDSALSGTSVYVLICGPKNPQQIGVQLLEADDEIIFDNNDKIFCSLDYCL